MSHNGQLSLEIPVVSQTPRPTSAPEFSTSILPSQSLYVDDSLMDYTPSSPSFEYTENLSSDPFEPVAYMNLASATDESCQYLTTGHRRHYSQPSTPTKLQTAFAEQWVAPSNSNAPRPDAMYYAARPRSQTLNSPLTGAEYEAYALHDPSLVHDSSIPYPYQQSSFSSTSSSFGPITPAYNTSTGLANPFTFPPTSFNSTDPVPQPVHARMQSTSSIASASSTASSYAESPYDSVTELALPPLINGKPPRFKPTPRQLAILVQTYERNRHVSAEERERLARRLGGGVKPRHVQVWFQNRRSKSRNKDSRSHSETVDGVSSTASSRRPSSAQRNLNDETCTFDSPVFNLGHLDAPPDLTNLRMTVQEPNLNLVFFPITKLVIGDWSRVLSSSASNSATAMLGPAPDLLGYASPLDQTITWFLSYAASSFKLVYQLGSITSVELEAHDSKHRDYGLVDLKLESVTAPACFVLKPSGWSAISDFTNGAASRETTQRVTGPKMGLVVALRQLVAESPSFAAVCAGIPGIRPVTFSRDGDVQSALQAYHFPHLLNTRLCPLDPSPVQTLDSVQLWTTASAVETASAPSHFVMGHHRRRSVSQPIPPNTASEAFGAEAPQTASSQQYFPIPLGPSPSGLQAIDLSNLCLAPPLLTTDFDSWDTTLEPTPTHTTPGFSPAVWASPFTETRQTANFNAMNTIDSQHIESAAKTVSSTSAGLSHREAARTVNTT